MQFSDDAADDDPMNDPTNWFPQTGVAGWSQSDGFLSSEKIITCTFLLGYYIRNSGNFLLLSWQKYHHTEVLT